MMGSPSATTWIQTRRVKPACKYRMLKKTLVKRETCKEGAMRSSGLEVLQTSNSGPRTRARLASFGRLSCPDAPFMTRSRRSLSLYACTPSQLLHSFPATIFIKLFVLRAKLGNFPVTDAAACPYKHGILRLDTSSRMFLSGGLMIRGGI